MHQLAINDPRWLEFVRSRDDATPFHDPTWAALLGACYAMPVYVLAQFDAAGQIRAGMPVAVAPRMLGRATRLVSLPFTDAVAPLVDPDDAESFVQAADVHRVARGLKRIEIRDAIAGARHGANNSVIHRLPLSADPDELLARFTKSKRRDVRASERSGLTVRRAGQERDLTETFYRLHVDTRRRHGAPVQPKRFFRLLWERILEPGGGFALIAEEAGVAVACAIFLVGGGRIVYKYSASDISRRSQLPNDLLIWSAIKEACLGGLTSLDFGRSETSASGLRAFKSRWGALEEPLVYSTIGIAPTRAADGKNPALVATMLKRAPRLVVRATGELLYRYAA